MNRKLIILSADAMVTEDLELFSTLPGYQKYLEGGCRVNRVRSIYPTVTYPCHTTMMTGNYPNRHGVTSNFTLELNEKPTPWNWYAKAIRSRDIFTACKEKGLTTATVFWPVTGGHPANIDGARHQYGVFNEMVDRTVVDTDRFVQQLMGVQEELGLAEQTNLVVTSDHGQMEVQRIINPNVMLADYGFLDVNADGHVEDWKAFCLSNGLSAVVYLKNPSDEKTYQRVFRLLRWMRDEGVYGIGEVLTAEEADEKYHLDGPFSFVIESDNYTSFGENVTGRLVESFGDTDYRYGRASHGYYPEKGPQPIFLAKGPEFAENVTLEQGRLIDEAPTYAKILGVELPDTDGTPITAFMRNADV